MTMIRPDQTLQSMVYKLIPGLFDGEMARRRTFYQQHSQRDGSLSPELRGDVVSPYFVYTLSDSVSISLGYTNSRKTDSATSDQIASERYFLAPAACTVGHLHKLLRNKYQLDDSFKMKIRLNGDVLDEEMTMVDVAYLCSWDRDKPIQLSYDLAVKRSAVDDHTSVTVPTTKNCAINGEISQNEVINRKELDSSLVGVLNGTKKSNAIRSEISFDSGAGRCLSDDLTNSVTTSREKSPVSLNNNVSCEEAKTKDGSSVQKLEPNSPATPIDSTSTKIEPSAKYNGHFNGAQLPASKAKASTYCEQPNGVMFPKNNEKPSNYMENEYGCSYFSKVDATINDVIKQNLSSYSKTTHPMKRSLDQCWKPSNGVPNRAPASEDSGVDTDSSEKSGNRDKSSLDVYEFDVDAEDEPCSKRANFNDVNSKAVTPMAALPRPVSNMKINSGQQTDRSFTPKPVSNKPNGSLVSSNIKGCLNEKTAEKNDFANNIGPATCFKNGLVKSNTKTVGQNTILSCSKENGLAANLKINCSASTSMVKTDAKCDPHMSRSSFSGSFRPDSTAHLNSFISNYMVKPPVSYSSKQKPLNPVTWAVSSNTSVYSATPTNRNASSRMRPIAPHPSSNNQEIYNGNQIRNNVTNYQRSYTPSNLSTAPVNGNRLSSASTDPPTTTNSQNPSNCSELMMHLTSNTSKIITQSSTDVRSHASNSTPLKSAASTSMNTTPLLPPNSQALSQAQLLWQHAAMYPARCPVKRLPTPPVSRQPPALKPINDSRVPMKPDELNSFLQLVSKTAVSEPSGSWRLTTEASALLNTVSSLTTKTNDSKINPVFSSNDSRSACTVATPSVASSNASSVRRANDTSNIQSMVSSEITITKLPNKHQPPSVERNNSLTSVLKQVRKKSPQFYTDMSNAHVSAGQRVGASGSSMASLISSNSGSITITSPPASGDRVSASVTIEKLGNNCVATSASPSAGTAGVVVPARSSVGTSPKLDAIAENLAIRKMQGQASLTSPCPTSASLSTVKSFLTSVTVASCRPSLDPGSYSLTNTTAAQASSVAGTIAASVPPKNSLLACAPAPVRPATTTRPLSDSSLRHSHLPGLYMTGPSTSTQSSSQASSLDRIQNLTNSLS